MDEKDNRDITEVRELDCGTKAIYSYAKKFLGASYDLSDIGSVGILKSTLEGILKDLPDDDTIVINDIVLEDGRLAYFLEREE